MSLVRRELLDRIRRERRPSRAPSGFLKPGVGSPARAHLADARAALATSDAQIGSDQGDPCRRCAAAWRPDGAPPVPLLAVVTGRKSLPQASYCQRGGEHTNGEGLSAWIGREILPHESALRAWLLRIASPNDVEDIIQECYCRLSEVADFRTIASPRTYLFTMARNIVLQELRRSRIVRIDSVAEVDRYDLASDAPPPDRIVAGREELARIRRLIAELPPRMRQIVELRKIDQLSQREIARRLGVSLNVVENEASRGLKLVLARLTGESRYSLERADRDIASRHRRRH